MAAYFRLNQSMTPIVLALMVFTVIAQAARPTVPNIAGTWAIVPEASVYHDRVGQPTNIRIFGEGFVAHQDERTLTIAIDNDSGFVWRYKLDGTESYNIVPLLKGDEQTTSILIVQGNKITITTASLYESVSRTTRRAIELNMDGTLRVEAPFGEGGAMIGSVYRRTPEQVGIRQQL